MPSAARYEDGSYLASNPDWHCGDSQWKAGHIKDLVTANGVQPTSVVDVGCGAGGVLLALSDLWPSASLVGYDISPIPIGLLATSPPARINLHVGDVSDIDQHFDLLLSLDVFEHVPDYIGFLESMRQLADLFVFHIPLDLSAQSVIRRAPLMHVRSKVGHLHYFTKDTALATLADSGYETIECRLLNASRGLQHGRLRTRMAGIPRRLGERVSAELSARVLGGFTLLVLARVRET